MLSCPPPVSTSSQNTFLEQFFLLGASGPLTKKNTQSIPKGKRHIFKGQSKQASEPGRTEVWEWSGNFLNYD